MPSQTKVIFRPMDIFWKCLRRQNLSTSMDLGGTTIIFSQNWNFELKFVLVNPFWEKMTYRWLRIHFLSKYGSKMPQNQTVLQQLLNKKTLKMWVLDSNLKNKLWPQLRVSFKQLLTLKIPFWNIFWLSSCCETI